MIITRMDMFIIFSVALVVFCLGTYLLFSSGSGWDTVNGEVKHFEIKDAPLGTVRREYGDGPNTYYRTVDIHYQYRVNGREYSGSRVFAKIPNIISDAATIHEFEKEFVVGSQVTVYFNSKDPSKSCLRVANISIAKKIFIIFFLTLIVTLTLGVAIFLKRIGFV